MNLSQQPWAAAAGGMLAPYRTGGEEEGGQVSLLQLQVVNTNSQDPEQRDKQVVTAHSPILFRLHNIQHIYHTFQINSQLFRPRHALNTV